MLFVVYYSTCKTDCVYVAMLDRVVNLLDSPAKVVIDMTDGRGNQHELVEEGW